MARKFRKIENNSIILVLDSYNQEVFGIIMSTKVLIHRLFELMKNLSIDKRNFIMKCVLF